jgi:DNA topoisomerase-1
MALLQDAAKRTRPGPKVLRELGAHPKDKKPIVLYQGRFGPYVKHGQQTASLRKGQDPDALTIEEAVTLLEAKAAKSGGPRGGRGGGAGKRTPKAGGRRGRTADKAGGGATKP